MSVGYIGIMASSEWACAIDDLDQVMCWGTDPLSSWDQNPALVLEGSYRSISMGGEGQGCAVTMTGEATCWWDTGIESDLAPLATGEPQ